MRHEPVIEELRRWTAARSPRFAHFLMVLAAVGSLAHTMWISVVNDDAGISLAYARTFASGDGLRLTTLSPRVEGYSDPLWVLWLSLGYALKIDGPRFAQLSGAVFAALAVMVVGLVPSRRYAREPRPLDALAPWILALDTTYCYWAGAGLETGAFALALSIALAWGSAVPTGLLAVLRPEGPLYVMALGADRVRRRGRARARAIEELLRWLVVAALPALSWLAFRRIYYGQWLPNSYFAKRDWDYGGPHYLATWFRADPWHWALCGVPLVLIRPSTRRASMPAFASSVAAAAFIVLSRGDWMEEHRFVAHALPAVALLASLVPAAVGPAPFASAGCALALLASSIYCVGSRGAARRKDPVLPLAYVAEQARAFRSEAARLGLIHPRIAHFDVGGFALESGGEVIDLAGLADLYIARVGYQSHGRVRDYLFDEVDPDMINVHGPCEYLRSDPRLQRYYRFAVSTRWGENWVRKDDNCPRALPPVEALAALPAAQARARWLCARARFPLHELPDVRTLSRRFADEGLKLDDPDRLATSVALDPTSTRAARRLLELRLAAAHVGHGDDR